MYSRGYRQANSEEGLPIMPNCVERFIYYFDENFCAFIQHQPTKGVV